jgi:hypothetical protein
MPPLSSTAKIEARASATSTTDPGCQMDPMMPSLKLREFFPSALVIPAVIPRCTAPDLVLLFQQPDPFPGIPEFRRLPPSRRDGPRPSMSACLSQLGRGCFGNPEVFGHLRARGFVPPHNCDHAAAGERVGKGLGMLNIRAARNESS